MKNSNLTFERVVACAAITVLISAIIGPAVAQTGERGYAEFFSNLHTVGLATQVYVGDFDDHWPVATVAVPFSGGYRFIPGTAYPVPADVIDPASMSNYWSQPERRIAARSFWMNALTPYVPGFSTFENPVAVRTTMQGDKFDPNVEIVHPGVQMNGLLHTIQSPSIESPSLVPAFWHVQKISFRGRCFSSPALNCGFTNIGPWDCRFNPTGPPSSNLKSTGSSYGLMFVYNYANSSWQFGRKMLISFADTSVRPVPAGSKIEPDYVPRSMAYLEPWASVTSSGVPYSFWVGGPDCSAISPQDSYPCFFRPDRTQ